MKIQKKQENNKLTLTLEGRLDTMTAPDLEVCLKSTLEGISDLTFDMTELEYISSAGLRALLAAQKKMNKVGKMTVTGVNETVNEVFEVTGFSDILTIE